MYADLFANAIILTKSEARNAGKPGTETYADLMNLRRDFPNFPIKIAAAPKKNNRIKGLDYDYMEKYIKNHKSELLAEFYELCGNKSFRHFETPNARSMKRSENRNVLKRKL